MKVDFSLRDLRTAKGISQKELAHVLKISPALYCSIESGHRKPAIDTLYILSALYGTSMDFIYHAFYRQTIVYLFPDEDLQYAFRQAKKIDIKYLRERFPPPYKIPELPVAVVLDQMGEDASIPFALSDTDAT